MIGPPIVPPNSLRLNSWSSSWRICAEFCVIGSIWRRCRQTVVGAQPARLIVLEQRPTEGVAARLGDRADHPTERAAVLGLEPRRLHLHFLQVFEHGVLALRAMNLADDRHAVHGEVVLTGGRAIHLEAAFELARVDRRQRRGQRLEAAALRDDVELLGRDVSVLSRRRDVDERRGGQDLHGLRHASDAQRRVHGCRRAEEKDDVGRLLADET